MPAPSQDFTLDNLLAQALDVAGSNTRGDQRTLSDENSGFGIPITGQTGAASEVTAIGGGAGADEATIDGLTGMSTSSLGRFLTVTGMTDGANNGTFLITQATGSGVTSVRVLNSSATAGGTGSWTERDPYTLEDDLNFERTDRRSIKGTTNYYDVLPTYERPTAVGTAVTASIQNIAGKTTDAKALTVNRKELAALVVSGSAFMTLTGTGLYTWADAVDRTGVPIKDSGAETDSGSFYVEIINPATEAAMEVLSGALAGQRVFGLTRSGSATEPDFVEVEFRSVTDGDHISSSVVYSWESGHPLSVNVFYGFRERLDNMSDTALRTVLTNGIVGDADMNQDIVDIRTTIDEAFTDGATSLAGLLTNTAIEFVFSDLPDATPSVVEALNTLNTQIGDRNYTGAILTDGETIATSLQALADSLAASGVITRTIERFSGSSVVKNTAHTLPNGISYTQDGGQNMWVFWRGVLKDPGTVALGDDYDETSTTTITPFSRIRQGDHVSYFIKG